MSNSTNRKINIWINDKQVVNSYKGISNAIRQARNEQANMTIGTKEYYQHASKLKKLEKILNKHKALQGGIKRGWRKIVQEIKTVAIGNFAANILTTVIQKIGLAFDSIISKTGEFEQGLTNVKTLMSTADIKKYGDALEKGSMQVSEMGFAQNDTNKSLFDAISAGVEAGESIQFLKKSAILAKGGVTQLGIATDGMTTIQNAYNLSIDEAGNVADSFFSAQKEGKTTVEELASSVGKVVPIASNLGVSYQELLSASAKLTKSGISTRFSMTYLKAALGNLMKPGTEAAKVLKKFGIPMGASQIKAAGFTETIEKLNEVIVKNPDALAKMIPSLEGQNAILSLTGEGLQDYKNILNNVTNDVGKNSSLQKAYNMQMETMPNIIAKAKAELTNLTVQLGQKLAPVIKKIIPVVMGMSKKIMTFIDFLVRNSKAIGVFAKLIGIAVVALLSYKAAVKLSVLWSNRLRIATLKKIIVEKSNIIITTASRIATLAAAAAQALFTGNLKRARAAMRLLNVTMKANPIVLIATAIVAAYVAFRVFKKEVDTSEKAFKGFNKELVKSQTELNNVFEALKNTGRGTKERKELIKKVNKEYGKYLPNLLTEKSSLLEIETAQRAANKALMKNLAIKSQNKAIEETFQKSINVRAKLTGELIELATRKNKHLAAQATSDLNKLIDLTIKKGEIAAKEFNSFIRKYDTEKFAEGRRFQLNKSLNEILEAEKEKSFELEKIKASFSSYITETEDKETKQRLFALRRRQSAGLTDEKEYLEKLLSIHIDDLGNAEYKQRLHHLRRKHSMGIMKEKEYLERLKALKYDLGIKDDTYKSGNDDKEKDNDYSDSSDNAKKKEKEIDLYKKYVEKYKSLQKELSEIRRLAGMEGRTEREKELSELTKNYIKMLEVTESAVEDLETKQLSKAKLTEDETELLGKFYKQQLELAKWHDNEIEKINEKHDKLKLQKKKEVQQQINEILMSSEEKEIHSITQKYQTLINQAEKYGIDTVELYKKMYDEIDAIKNKDIREEKTDIFGMTDEDWSKFNHHFNNAKAIVGQLGNIWNNYNELRNNKEDESLRKYEENIESRKDILQQQLNRGMISESQYNRRVASLEDNLDSKRKKIAHDRDIQNKKSQKFNATVNMLAASIGFLSNPGGYAGIGLAALALIDGAITIRKINSQPIPSYGKGGRINKREIAEIGELGPEIVLSNKIVSSSKYGHIADDLARVQEGKQPRFLDQPVSANFNGIQKAISKGESNLVNHNTVINQVDSEGMLKMTDEVSQMRNDMMKMVASIDKLEYLKAIISEKEFKERDKDKELLKRYSNL